MKKVIKVLLVISFIVIGYIIYSLDLWRNKGTKTDNAVENDTQISLDNITCTDEQLRIDTLDERILRSTNSMKLIRDNCLIVMKEDFFDVTNDGVEDIILNLGNIECVSCHPRHIAVIDSSNDVMTFNKFYDAVNGSARVRDIDKTGFEVVHSFEWNSTPNDVSKATETVSVYSFNKDSRIFEEVESYEEPQSYYDVSY